MVVEALVDSVAAVGVDKLVEVEIEAEAEVLVALRTLVDSGVGIVERMDCNAVVDNRVGCTAAEARTLAEAELAGVGRECRRLSPVRSNKTGNLDWNDVQTKWQALNKILYSSFN